MQTAPARYDDAQRDDAQREDAHQHDPREVGPRAAVLGVYAVAVGLAARRAATTGAFPRPTPWPDVLRMGLAVHKLSRLVTKSSVATPLRRPFTAYEAPGDPAEVREHPEGTGVRRAVGELVSCPFCLDVWLATAAVLSHQLAPRWHNGIVTVFDTVAIADFLQHAYVVMAHESEG